MEIIIEQQHRNWPFRLSLCRMSSIHQHPFYFMLHIIPSTAPTFYHSVTGSCDAEAALQQSVAPCCKVSLALSHFTHCWKYSAEKWYSLHLFFLMIEKLYLKLELWDFGILLQINQRACSFLSVSGTLWGDRINVSECSVENGQFSNPQVLYFNMPTFYVPKNILYKTKSKCVGWGISSHLAAWTHSS